jgi:hypothetical protein
VNTTPSTNFTLPPRQLHQLWRRKQFFPALRDSLDFLIVSLPTAQGEKAFAKWQAQIATLYGEIFERPRMLAHCESYLKALHLEVAPTGLVFALHTIYGFFARALVVQHLLSHHGRNHIPASEFFRELAAPEFYQCEFGVRNFLPALWDEEILALAPEAAFFRLFALAENAAVAFAAPGWQNALTDLYQTLLPQSLRHDLGEFFTPNWLAEKTMAMSGFDGEIDKIVFDPGCGSGSFLLTAAAKKLETKAPVREVLKSVIGCDLNPLSVLSARLNFLLLLSKYGKLPLPNIELPIFHYDSVFQAPLGNTSPQEVLATGCDYLIGNPPWISWNCLPPAYRKRLENELLAKYVLFDFRGQSAQLGHGNDDYLATFTLVTMHYYLREHGICSFVIKQPLLTNISGKTFRHFSIRHVDETIPLRVVKVADLRELDPFGIANEAAILVLEKGTPTVYPVAYEIWTRSNGQIEIQAEQAQPANETNLSSPWIILSEPWAQTRFMEGDNPYEIRHGLKHDAAAILILDIVANDNQHLKVKCRDSASATTYEIESKWVYPFLQPRHLRRWGISGNAYVLLPQRKAGEDNESELAEYFPRTHAFLKNFEARLAARRSKVFLTKPFYGLFGLGEYTRAPYKVCWVGLGFHPEFAVAEELRDWSLGQKTVVPDGTIYFMPFSDPVEAHFVCALLNSPLVRTFLSARSGKSKRGLSKRVVEQLALPKFNLHDERHVYLAQVSRQMHEAVRRQILADDIPADFEKVVENVFRMNACLC